MTLPNDDDVSEQLKEIDKNQFEIVYQCSGCAASYGKVRPERCEKCGSYTIEKINRLKIKSKSAS